MLYLGIDHHAKQITVCVPLLCSYEMLPAPRSDGIPCAQRTMCRMSLKLL